jgi:hypothetical protein
LGWKRNFELWTQAVHVFHIYKAKVVCMSSLGCGILARSEIQVVLGKIWTLY